MKEIHIIFILLILAINVLMSFFLKELYLKEYLSIISLNIAIGSVYFNVIKFNNGKQKSIAKATFELIAKWDDEKLLRARKYTRTLRDNFEKDKKTYTLEKMQEDVCKGIIDENGDHKDEALRESLILVFNFFELVEYSCDKGIVDKEAIKKHLGNIIHDFINERFTLYLERVYYKDQDNMLKGMKNFADEMNLKAN